MKVIVRSNDCNSPYWIGEYMGKDPTCYNLPVVINNQGERFLVCGLILPYSDKLVAVLDSMDNKSQWDLFVQIRRFWSEHDV